MVHILPHRWGQLALAGCQVPTKATPSLSLLNWTAGRKYDKRLMGRDKDRKRSLTNYRHRENRLHLGKLIYCQSKVRVG